MYYMSQEHILEVSRMCWRNCSKIELDCGVDVIRNNRANYFCASTGCASRGLRDQCDRSYGSGKQKPSRSLEDQ